MTLFLKRTLDIIISLLALMLLTPVFMVISIAILLALGRPILFRQRRPGMHGKPFEMIKFRSMRKGTDSQGNLLPDNARLTRLGRFLRSTSLDELPELYVVLRGEMSLVGPRPLLMEYLELYSPEQARRHDVKPGMTGWAQINGRNSISWDEKFKLDVWYTENMSLRLDITILLKTIWKVIRRDGISADTHVTMPIFNGSCSTQKDSP